MREALVADLAAIGRYQIVTTIDPRFPVRAPPSVEVVTMPRTRSAHGRLLDILVRSADAVWLIAPETGGCLARLAARATRNGIRLLGSGPAAIRAASNKARLPALLARHGIAHPDTRTVGSREDSRRAAALARELGYPLIIKPARGAGCDGVSLVRGPGDLNSALAEARRTAAGGTVLLQRYVRGVAASVSLLGDGHRAVALAVNSQSLQTSRRRGSRSVTYKGGRTPLQHPLAGRAATEAARTCEALGGLRGYLGVDLVLTDSGPVVIEVNPRLTTAYLGLRAATDENVAAMAIAACEGILPEPPPIRETARFTASGRVVQTHSPRGSLYNAGPLRCHRHGVSRRNG
jgi:predicted ATP-grasp superfamily ATP-dependent carboligase